jgi:hypothetical protein
MADILNIQCRVDMQLRERKRQHLLPQLERVLVK